MKMQPNVKSGASKLSRDHMLSGSAYQRHQTFLSPSSLSLYSSSLLLLSQYRPAQIWRRQSTLNTQDLEIIPLEHQ